MLSAHSLLSELRSLRIRADSSFLKLAPSLSSVAHLVARLTSTPCLLLLFSAPSPSLGCSLCRLFSLPRLHPVLRWRVTTFFPFTPNQSWENLFQFLLFFFFYVHSISHQVLWTMTTRSKSPKPSHLASCSHFYRKHLSSEPETCPSRFLSTSRLTSQTADST